MLIPWILTFGLLDRVISVCGAALLFVCTEKVRKLLVTCLISYAIGTLIGAKLKLGIRQLVLLIAGIETILLSIIDKKEVIKRRHLINI